MFFFYLRDLWKCQAVRDRAGVVRNRTVVSYRLAGPLAVYIEGGWSAQPEVESARCQFWCPFVLEFCALPCAVMLFARNLLILLERAARCSLVQTRNSD